MTVDAAVSRLANRNSMFAEIRDRKTAIAALAPTRHPDRWCLCGHAGCLGWSLYLEEAKQVYGHCPTRDEVEADATIRATVREFPQDGAR